MAISDRLNKLTTDITNAYTSIENKSGTIPANKNTNNLSTAIDSIQSSNIIGATAEGEILSLTNTKAMPYSDYVVKGKSEQDGEPSPSNPSDIHSVADDVNLFDGNANTINSGTIKTIINTGVRITLSSSGTFRYSGIEIGGAELLGKTITLYSTITPSSNNDGAIFLYYGNSSNMAVSAVTGGGLTNTGSKTTTIANEFPTNCDRIYGLFYANRNGTGNTNDYVDYTNLKIQYRDTATPYSEHGKGTVTIKQRGKNLFNTSNIISSATDYTITVQDGGFIIRTGGMSNGGNLGLLKDLCPNLKVGNKFKFNWDTNATRNNSDVNYIYLGSYANTIRKDITYTCTQEMLDSETFFYGQQGQYYKNIIFYLEGQTSDYEPYQGYDKVFQTEPLRSLPNGVKDTIEADGIHRRVGRVVFDGTENWDNYSSIVGSTEIVQCRLMLSSNYKSRVGFSDRFLVIADYSAIEHIVIGGGLNAVFIHINKSRLSTEDIPGFKNWLSNNNTELLYELATEVIEPFTQQQAITYLDIIKTGTYEGTTNMYTDEDVKPTIGVGYYKKS